MTLPATASQTVGPFFHIGLTKLSVSDLAAPEVGGKRVTIQGRVLDGDGNPISDALIELWQANQHGKYEHPEDAQAKPLQRGFKGFGRIATNGAGEFRFATIKPGRVPGPAGTLQAPHIVVAVFMRGLLKHLVSRIYFPDEPANTDDPILLLVEPERRATLIATNAPGREGALEWNVVCSGENETVFFDY
jgi:protocatechuate 3,4-dioxygenase, alpha subunit